MLYFLFLVSYGTFNLLLISVLTDLPSRNGYEKTYRPPGPIPSPHTPRIFRNAGSRLHAVTTNATVVLVIILWKMSLDSKTFNTVDRISSHSI